MKKQNTQTNVVPIRNPLAEYKRLSEEVKSLEKAKAEARATIIAMMDEGKSDLLTIGDFKAERQVIEQFRIDSEKAKAILGERFPEVTTLTSQTRLTVIGGNR